MFLKRNAWVLVLALALSGAMVAGCNGDDDGGEAGNGGTGGTGGNGGTGGDGGTGGTGGSDTCDVECRAGEECVQRAGDWVCECEQSPDSCTGMDFCNDDLRCQFIEDFVQCLEPDLVRENAQTGEKFICLDGMFNVPVWVRGCEGGAADCKDPSTFCLAEMTAAYAPFCMFNYCDDSSWGPNVEAASGGPFPENGELFGGCNTTVGYDDGTPFDGTCRPQHYSDGSVGGICQKNGASPVGGPCKFDAYTTEPDFGCATDSICLGFAAAEPAIPCTGDAQCAVVPTKVGNEILDFEGYCAHAGYCQPLNNCYDICNAGTAVPPAVPEAAGCNDPAGSCTNLSGITAAQEIKFGYCRTTCDVFDPAACPEYPEGQQRNCYPFFDGASTQGFCIDQASTTVAVGAECAATEEGDVCPDGAACVRLGETAPFACHAWCECPGGFNTDGVCNDAAASTGCLPSGATCRLAVAESTAIGVCVPAP